jgi:hypothetical protein
VIAATASFSPAPHHRHEAMSWTSTSLKRLYYLNGANEVRYLAPDGSQGVATQIKLRTNEQAGFAVSPDDKRIAVSVFSYDSSYHGMRMYVEDLDGGGHQVQIFESQAVAEFPIAWTGGNLVIAVSTPQCCGGLQLNPYGASTFHIAEPDSGRRLMALCSNLHLPVGPVEGFGVMCADQGAQFFRWDGTELPVPGAIPYPSDHRNAVSPDGRRVAVAQQGQIRIWDSIHGDDIVAIPSWLYGWLDGDRIVIQRDPGTQLSIYDLKAKRNIDVAGTEYLGSFPARIS